MFLRKSQKGRSAIEMLGVLGIMGLITMLGIGAYNIATRNVKGNNIKAEVSAIAQKVKTITQPDAYDDWVGDSTDLTGSQKTFKSAFVDTGFMKPYNGMGVGLDTDATTTGYTITGVENTSFTIHIGLENDKDCAIVRELNWSEAINVGACDDTGIAITFE